LWSHLDSNQGPLDYESKVLPYNAIVKIPSPP
jgi:hypothetical protein